MTQGSEPKKGTGIILPWTGRETGDASIYWWQMITPWVDWRAMGPDMRTAVKKKYTTYLLVGGGALLLLLFLRRR